MYAGGGNGSGAEGPFTETGVFKTTDGGNSWTAINNGLTDHSVNVLWIDNSNPQNLLTGGEFGGIFHTTDGGQSWRQVSPDAPVSAIVSFNGGVLAGTGLGFEFSSDGGTSWTLIQGTTAAVRCLAVNGRDVIGGLENGVVMWRTPTSQVWQVVATNPDPSNQQNSIFDVAIDPVDPATAYYGRGCCGSSLDLVYHTANRGATWNLITPPDNGFSQALAVRSSDRAVLVAGQGYFLASTDFGATWQTMNAPWDSRRIFVLPNGSLVMGSDHGLHWTDNMGSSWLDITKTLSTGILYAVAANGNTVLTSSQDFGPFVSTDGGKTWRGASGSVAEGGAVAINPGNPSYCYAFSGPGIAVSKDGCVSFESVAGPTWTSYNPPDSPSAGQNSITISPTQPSTIFAAAVDGVWSSTDWGTTWTHLRGPFQQVTNIVLDPQDPSAIYVCASSGFFQSLDGGVNWIKLPLPTSSAPYVAAVSPTDSKVIVVAMAAGAGRGGGVFRSTDRGLTFQSVNQGLPTVFNGFGDQAAIAFNPNPPTGTTPIVALATSMGIYASSDLGTTWMNVSANAIPQAFSFVQWSQGYLWASTWGQGVLRSDQPISSATFSSALKVTGGPIWFTNIMGISSNSGSQTLQITTAGAAQNFTVAIAQSSSECGNWLSVDSLGGTTTGTVTGIPVTVSYSLAALPAGTSARCTGTVTVTSGGDRVTIPATLQILQVSQSRLQQWNLAFTDTPPGLMSMSMVFDSIRRVAVMFGGRVSSAAPVTEPLCSASGRPCARDSVNTYVYSNTYQYAPTGWNQISTANSPPARFWSAMAYDDHRQRVVLFGGQNNSTTFGDTWEFDGANWSPVSTVHSPGAQSATSMTYDSCRQKTVLFDTRGQTWEYNGADWTAVTTAAAPPARNLAAMVFDSGHCRALLYGGLPGSGPGRSDTWSYDGTNWTQLNVTAPPPGRWGHVMAFDTGRGRVVLFGGYGPAYPAGADTNDTWEFDGATWAQVFPQAPPPSLEQAAMVYDQSRSRSVMFGAAQAWEYTPGPVWAIGSTHTGTFSRGQRGATYTVTVGNTVWTDQTSGTVTVLETLPPGLTLASMAGAGWTCDSASLRCTRTDPLPAGAAYPPITVAVNIAADAPPWVTNSVSVSGCGLVAASGTDLTTITAAPPVGTSPPSISITPPLGTGSHATFNVTATEASGIPNLVSVALLVNAGLTGTGGCFVNYNPANNSLYLANNAVSTWIGPSTVGSGSVLSNSQCSVNPSAASVSTSGTSLTVNVPVAFTAAFTGPKSVWGYASNSANLNSGYQLTGTWTVGATASKIGIFNSTQSVFLLDANGDFAWGGQATDMFFPWGTANHNPKYIVVMGDWNGSGTKKIGIFDPATAIWLLDYNGDGVYTPGVDKYFAWGSPGDIPVVGDWNGTGTTKVGTFGPTTGLWLLDYNGNYAWDGPGVDRYFPWGSAGDTPVVGDWNGGGTTKVGTFGPNTGLWLLDYNGNCAWDGPSVDRYFPWGSGGDTPVVGDWNGSGTAKVGTFGPKTGLWLLDLNGNFTWDGPAVDKYFPWGSGGDTPVIGDWNGSGTTKVGTFGPGTALWLLDYNGNFNWDGSSVDKYFPWGSPGDTPAILK
jgi:hypothetical protein